MKALHPLLRGELQRVERPEAVDLVAGMRVFYRLLDVGDSREVHDRLEIQAGELVVYEGHVDDAPDDVHARRDVRPYRLETVAREVGHDVPADEPLGARDEHSQAESGPPLD